MAKIQIKKKYIYALAGVLFFIVALLALGCFCNFKKNSRDFKAPCALGEERKDSIKATKAIVKNKKFFAPILSFHHIAVAPAKASEFDKEFFLEPVAFEKVIQALLENNYQPIFAGELVDYLERGVLPPEKAIVLTFDDADEDFYTNAYPILEKYNIKSTLFVITGVRGKGYMSAEQIKELAKTGLVEMESHTVIHESLPKVDDQEKLKQLRESKDWLEKLLGKKIDLIAYPNGLVDEQTEKIAKEVGYRAGFKYNYSFWQNQNLFEISRLGVMPGADVIKLLEKMKKE